MKLLLICSFLLVTCFANSQQKLVVIADSLFKQQQFFEASIYAEQILFEPSTVVEKMQAIDIKIKSLKATKNYKAIIEFISNCYAQTIPENYRLQLIYEEIMANYLLKNYSQAIHISQFYATTLVAENQLIDVVKIVSYNMLEEWKTADSLYSVFCSRYSLNDTLIKTLYLNLPKFKSEKKATFLSTYFPGIGQLYAGKTFEGVASFVFQVGSVWAGVAWWQRAYKISSIAVAGSLWSSFNDGGKRRAKKLVQNYNQQKIEDYNNTLNKAILHQTQHLFIKQ